MSQITLKELYVDELRDLWSANGQMARALKKISSQATNAKLKALVDSCPASIERHTQSFRD